MSKPMWHRIALTALLALPPAAFATDSAKVDQTGAEEDWLPEAARVTAAPATVPVVPLPPAVFGSLASVGVICALRCSRYRRWLTLRS